MLVELPVMCALFPALRHLSPDQKEKTLYGWTVGLFDSASHAKLFGAPIAASFKSNAKDLAFMNADGTTVKVVAAILVAMMIITTYLTSRQMILKTGWAEDPQQKLMQRLMVYGIPISLLISGTLFPIGVVIYSVTTNLFSLGQQFWVLRKYPPPVPAGKAATGTAPAGTASGPAMSSLTDMILGRKSKPAAKGTAAHAKGAPKGGGKALAPQPGAQPVNPQRGTPAKSPAAPGAAGSRADDGSRATSQGGAAKAKGTAGQGASAAKRGTA